MHLLCCKDQIYSQEQKRCKTTNQQ